MEIADYFKREPNRPIDALIADLLKDRPAGRTPGVRSVAETESDRFLDRTAETDQADTQNLPF
jgi:hypothetical protein